MLGREKVYGWRGACPCRIVDRLLGLAKLGRARPDHSSGTT